MKADTCKDLGSILASDVEVALRVIDWVREVREKTGHGNIELATKDDSSKIELVMKDGVVLYLRATVRENL